MQRVKKDQRKKNPKIQIFSKRQSDVIRCWGRLFDPELIAHEMNIKVSTVQTHLRRMRKKLGVKKTVEVWDYVIQEGNNINVE